MSNPADRQRLLKAGRLADVIERSLKAEGKTLADVGDFDVFVEAITRRAWIKFVHEANLLRLPGERMHHEPGPDCRVLVAQRLRERAALETMSDEELFAGLR